MTKYLTRKKGTINQIGKVFPIDRTKKQIIKDSKELIRELKTQRDKYYIASGLIGGDRVIKAFETKDEAIIYKKNNQPFSFGGIEVFRVDLNSPYKVFIERDIFGKKIE